MTGEFGRTPKINPQRNGRDHYPRAMFMLMAGGGIRGGQVIGATDEKGMEPTRDPALARRRGGHVLPRAGHRSDQGIPHEHGPAGDDRPQRHADRRAPRLTASGSLQTARTDSQPPDSILRPAVVVRTGRDAAPSSGSGACGRNFAGDIIGSVDAFRKQPVKSLVFRRENGRCSCGWSWPGLSSVT